MSWIIFGVLIVLAAGTIAVLILRGRSPQPDTAASDVAAPSTEFHAVSIKHGAAACQPAKDLTARRFLSTEAPLLPLPECDADECQCRFVHHKDRRANHDRRSPFGSGGVGGSGSYAQEQRDAGDRRRGDSEDFFD